MKLILFFVLITLCLSLDVPEEVHVRLHPSTGDKTRRLYELGIESFHKESDGNLSIWANLNQLKTLDTYAIKYERVPKQKRERFADKNMGSYHTHEEMDQLFGRLQQEYPELMSRFSIGTSVEGRSLSGARITGPGDTEGRPQFKYIGNMHGDETVGREVLINLVEHLVTEYHRDEDIKQILDTTIMYILPSMNPDGFHRVRRSNSRGYDLNRNFPDQYRNSPSPRQPEVQAVMDWSLSNDFVLSANLHGGDLCANYPYDGNVRMQSGRSSPTPDDNLFKELALAYSKAHGRMFRHSSFPRGITNGAHWYVLYGGMQDWNYLNTNDMEITLELSHRKRPYSNRLTGFWEENKPALLAYIKKVHTGAKGKVTRNGQPVQGVEISVNRVRAQPINHKIKTNADGWYWRLLTPGDWEIHVEGKVETVFIREDRTTAKRVDFQL